MALDLTVIRGGEVITRHQTLRQAEVWIQQKRILAIHPFGQVTIPLGAHIVDARGLLVTPGWIDLQINGGFGMDFTENPSTIWEVAARLPRYGTTSFLPTIITAPMEVYAQAIEIWKAGPPVGWRGATPLGLHFEGPFLNPEKKGAHNPTHLRLPDLRLVETWRPENGVRLVTLAPELPGAHELIQELQSRGVVVSAGHSQATFEQAEQAFKAGVSASTHLFNAMAPLNHRQPGLAGAVLTNAQITTGLIVDGLHVHPALVQLIWQVKSKHSLALVTDAMAALGMPVGTYRLGDLDVIVNGDFARLSDGTLAGSLLTHDTALRNVMRYTGCEATETIPALSSTPATLLGLTNKGVIRPGADGDLTLVTRHGQVRMTIVAGQVLNQNL